MDLKIPVAAVRTTCAYCGVGCGVSVASGPAGLEVRGDEQHPANKGRLCVKGSALGGTLGMEGRLLQPMLREDGALRAADWDTALDGVAEGFSRIIAEHGPEAVAMYVSGQLLTEDYYVANKFMKGYVGSANIDTNSRLCMSSSVAGHKRAFGEDIVPGCYEDFELADLVVLAGSNAAWCHPVLFQRVLKAREARPGMKVVVIDPRRTATCELADLHLPLRPGTDVWLFNGLLRWLQERGCADSAWVERHTVGVADALAEAEECTPEHVARMCRVALEDVLTFYRWFEEYERAVTAYSQGVNQSSAGTDKVNAIINCHLLTGRIGRPGMGPFSLTGQPNAMGGREVGGLANTLAAHLEIDNPRHRELVREFWGSPRIAARGGLKAVELFEAIDAGRVKAVWIMGTNPVVSMPDADRVRKALAGCELVVVSDVVERTDCTEYADVLLPALAWGEKDGTVTNSERVISRQRAFLSAPGQARGDWWAVCEAAKRMGFDGFDFAGPHAIFAEHARLSAYRNDGERLFNLSGAAGLSRAQYDALEPVGWPVGAAQRRGARLFGDGRFQHPDGRARLVATRPRLPEHGTDAEYPLALNTGRVRDQWHTMTRTGRAAQLAGHTPECFVDLHPQDALLAGVREGELARVRSSWGALVARVRHSGGIARGSVFVPIHWSGQTASDARVGALVNPVVDPISGEPEFKHTPVAVEPFPVDWHAFILTRRGADLSVLTFWTRVQEAECVRYEAAGRGRIHDRTAWVRQLVDEHDPDADWLEYEDASEGIYRAVLLAGDQLQAIVFISSRPDLPPRTWLAAQFGKTVDARTRAALLAGQPLGLRDDGPVVCSCFGVGAGTIKQAIIKRQLCSVAEVTACLKAGGNCGSCVPEIRKLLDSMEQRSTA